jgi:hypothetical protein
MGREPVGVDILTSIPAVELDAAWERRVEPVCDEEITSSAGELHIA